MCDRVAIIVEGRIVVLDTVPNLKYRSERRAVVEVTLADASNCVVARRIEGTDVDTVVRTAVAQATAEGQRVMALNSVQPTLEGVFVRLTGLTAEVMLAEKGGKGQSNAGG